MNRLFRKYLKIEYVLLFLCAIEFLGKFNYLVILLFLYLLFRNLLKSSYFQNKNFIYLFLFSIFYFLFAGNSLSITDAPVWIFSFLIGMTLVRDKQSLFVILVILALGTGLHGFLTGLKHYSSTGILGTRIMDDFWTGNPRGATSQSCAFLIFSGLLIPGLHSPRLSKKNKLIVLAFIVGLLFNAVVSASRSALFYPILTAFLAYLFVIEKRRVLVMIFTTISILIILSLLYINDFGGIQTFFEKQLLYERFVNKVDGGIAENSRQALWSYFFKNFYNYPFGGLHESTLDNFYAHNIVLDTYSYAGILNALLLIFIIIRSMKTTIYIVKKADIIERSCIIGVYTSFFLIFMTEPIIQASTWYFSLFLMYCGMLEKRKHTIQTTI